MRIANNIRLTAFSKSADERSEIDTAILALLTEKGLRAEDVRKHIEHEDLKHENLDPIYKTKLWLDKQPLVRAFLQIIRAGLTDKDVKEIKQTLAERMDQRENVSIRLEKQAFLEGKILLASHGDVLQLRINIAAHPKNPETVKEVFCSFLDAAPDNI